VVKLTEPAIHHFDDGINTCWAVYEQANTYRDISKINEPQSKENKEKLSKYLSYQKNILI
jgi:hypothetical protein